MASQMSATCTSGRQGVPSLVILICLVVQANPARLLSTISNRKRGDGPKAVAFRRHVGEKSSSAMATRARSTSTLHLAYAVCGHGSDSSVLMPSAPAPYTLHDEL